MAKEGMTMHDFHTNSSVCTPTRAALMTGRYQQRVGLVDVIVGNEKYDKGLPANLPTMGKIFKQNHYATGLFGKWHLGFLDKFNPVHHGFDDPGRKSVKAQDDDLMIDGRFPMRHQQEDDTSTSQQNDEQDPFPETSEKTFYLFKKNSADTKHPG